MVVFDPRPCSRTTTPTDCVRIVETEQPFAVFVMKRQLVVQPMGMLGRNRNLLYDKLDPTFAVRISDKTLAVEQRERIQAGVTTCHSLMLSPAHNLGK